MWRIARTTFVNYPRALVQKQQVRHHAPICGPPRNPMPAAQKLIIGAGMCIIWMILPYYCLFQIPRWSCLQRGVPYERDEIARLKKEEAAQAAATAYEAAAAAESAEVPAVDEKESKQ